MNKEQEVTFSGYIEKILYKSEESSFGVAVVKTEGGKLFTVSGTIPFSQVGHQVSCKGIWVRHPQFGMQIKLSECSLHHPTSALGIERYLGSGLIKGIGPSIAQKIVAAFGEKTLDIIEKNPERLYQVEGVGAKRIQLLIDAWIDQKEIAKVVSFLKEKGVSTGYAVKIYKKYGSQAVTLITQNPYQLCQDIWGIGFKTADDIAQKLGICPRSPFRIESGICHLISQASTQGHVYIPASSLPEELAALLSLSDDSFQEMTRSALHSLYEKKQVVVIKEKEKMYVTLPSLYGAEKGIAKFLVSLQNYSIPPLIDIDAAYAFLTAPSKGGPPLHEKQIEAILTACTKKVSFVTGGPGTGKTTLVRTLAQLVLEKKKRIQLAAPTGRAAKRLSESTGLTAHTLHRLLEFTPATMQFARNQTNALTVDLLIVDESSMIDVFLMHGLVKALPLTAHVLFLGDADQLPSVGPGNVFKDLMDSNYFSVTRLTEIFRQSQESSIIVNAHQVNKGLPLIINRDFSSDFICLKREEPEVIMQTIAHVLDQVIKKRGILIQDVIILSPMNRGGLGTAAINVFVQKLLFKEPRPALTRFGISYAVGDRVMQIRNNYDKMVFNGDIGHIKKVDLEQQEIEVAFGELIVLYHTSELDELTLAYCISIHKSQGCEFKAVIIIVHTQHFMLLKRNTLYTAITRAQKLCCVIGVPKAVAIAIRQNDITQRTTFLSSHVKGEVVCL